MFTDPGIFLPLFTDPGILSHCHTHYILCHERGWKQGERGKKERKRGIERGKGDKIRKKEHSERY